MKIQYDVIVIGSGLAGLACAIMLCKEGKRVCILEKNEQIGGSLQTFRREGVTFDTGVHYIGGLDKGQNLYRLFKYFGIMERLELQKMDEQGFDVVLFKDDSQEYPYGMGYENFRRNLITRFPDERQAIEKYCREIKSICDSFPLYNLKLDEYDNQHILTKGAYEFIAAITENEKLRNVLAGTNLLYAGVREKTPLYVHALVVNSYIESSWKCAAGSDQIAKLIAKNIKALGGEIYRKAEVKRLHVENGLVEFVELADGSKFYADTFISNINPTKTLAMTDTDHIRPVYRNRIRNLENSISVFVIYAIMKPGKVKYHNRNYYYYDELDVWKTMEYTEEIWPYGYALFEGVPEHDPEYEEAITIMAYMRFDEVKAWAGTENTTLNKNDRGEDYEAFKKRKAEKLLETVAIKFPEIVENIQSYYTSTPLSYRDYIGSDDGTMYGIVKDFRDPLKTFISPKTKVANLLLTGQNINLHGVLGVTVSAVLTCSMLLGKEYLLNKITSEN